MTAIKRWRGLLWMVLCVLVVDGSWGTSVLASDVGATTASSLAVDDLPDLNGHAEDWDFAEFDEAPPASVWGGVTGFWELRLGQRIDDAAHQRRATLAETRLELGKGWQWRGGELQLTADMLYDDIEESRHVDLETGTGWLDLREAWFQQKLGSAVEIKVGRQILTWGVGDLVFINDLFPKDWNSFLAGRDEQYLKAPADTVRLGFYTRLANLDLVYTPRFEADRYIDGRRLSYFNAGQGEIAGSNAIVVADRPDHSGDDDEWALRVYRRLGSYELALYGYRGFWKSPAGYDPIRGLAIFPDLQVMGGSARGPLGFGILSIEVGRYTSLEDRGGQDPRMNNGELRLLVGYEWELLKETTLGLQYYVEKLEDYQHYRDSLSQTESARDHYRQLVTARLTRQAMNQNLTLSLFVFYSATDKDAYLRPKIQYKVDDHWSLEGGANVFGGRRQQSFFGQFEDNSNLYAAVRYSF